MINILVGNVFATEDETVENQIEEDKVIEQKDDNVVEATAKVIKASEEKVVDNGGMMDYVQDVTVRILDGEYETEELEATYNLSYDNNAYVGYMYGMALTSSTDAIVNRCLFLIDNT